MVSLRLPALAVPRVTVVCHQRVTAGDVSPRRLLPIPPDGDERAQACSAGCALPGEGGASGTCKSML